MLTHDDVQAVVTRNAEDCPDVGALPDWADAAGIDFEAVAAIIGTAASALPGSIELPEGVAPEGMMAAVVHPHTVAAIARTLMVGFELGRIRRTLDADLPDPNNVTTDAPND